MARTRLTLALGAAALWAIAPGPAHASEPDPETQNESETPTRRLAPHPVITEVLFNVPKSDDADANADGARHSTGDEFVELFNPHPRTINLHGYTITNRLTTYDGDTILDLWANFAVLALWATVLLALAWRLAGRSIRNGSR